METLNYEVLAKSGYNGYILKNAPEKVLQFGEGNFLRAFVDYLVRSGQREGRLERQVRSGPAHRPGPFQDDQRAGGPVHPVPARQ